MKRKTKSLYAMAHDPKTTPDTFKVLLRDAKRHEDDDLLRLILDNPNADVDTLHKAAQYIRRSFILDYGEQMLADRFLDMILEHPNCNKKIERYINRRCGYTPLTEEAEEYANYDYSIPSDDCEIID